MNPLKPNSQSDLHAEMRTALHSTLQSSSHASSALRYTWAAVTEQDFEALLALRIAAMQPSLEALGRFSPDAARAHFRAGFSPADMHQVLQDHTCVALVTVCKQSDEQAFRLRHLYVHPSAQSQGLGTQLLCAVLEKAQWASSDVLVDVLKESRANAFYQGHGFVLEWSSAFDHHYRWRPK